MPVSIDIVRLCFSVYLNPNFGAIYPTKKPNVCSNNTDVMIFVNNTFEDTAPPAPEEAMPSTAGAFCATTPPQMSDTSSTLAKGVNLDSIFAKFGEYLFRAIPTMTGNNTTLVVAAQSAKPLTATELPTSVVASNGVTSDANIVEAVVNITDNATSAPAISDTRFDAVPPGEQPTKASPKNRCLPNVGCEFSKSAVPTR
mmetsp:Transcript_24621/g.36710  ORF Transcript_24621/g.36710 Transcript_24621/m.36710 type:complete len:199 (-) Transcript_24621:61-657(-)